MKLHVIALSAAALLASATLATAQYSGNTASTPGQTMQQQAPAPGASVQTKAKKRLARKPTHKRTTTGATVREKSKTSTKSSTK